MTRTFALLALALLAGCAHDGYRHPPAAALTIEAPPQDDRGMYLALIEAYRQKFSDSPQLRVLQAEALRRTGRNDDAAALYRGLLKTPQAAAAWHGLGLIAASEERGGEADDALARAVALEPLNTDYLGDLGFARLREGRSAEARTPLAQAAELAPGNPRAVANLALWTLLHGAPAQAEAMMRQANLPDSTRSEIYRLAGSLRNARPRDTAAGSGVAHRDAAAPPSTSTVAQPSMLERFGGERAPSPESTP
jgi:Flp pilus assembly protein TadD